LLARFKNGHERQNVLIIEDDPYSRDYVGRLLRGWGWQVTYAEDGKQGLERVSEQPPALIILDLMMPEMDGFEFLERLRTEEKWQRIPVVVLSAMELTPEQIRHLNDRVSNIVLKAESSQNEWIVNLAESIRSCTPKGGDGLRNLATS